MTPADEVLTHTWEDGGKTITATMRAVRVANVPSKPSVATLLFSFGLGQGGMPERHEVVVLIKFEEASRAAPSPKKASKPAPSVGGADDDKVPSIVAPRRK